TLDTAGANGIYKYSKGGLTMNLDVKDNGNTIRYVAFAKYTDGSVKYGEKQTTSLAEAMGQLS
ncbi:MAG: hypothetical protein K5695_18255, partial [Oscillospiraceae bacterium]|nr:hypothetical protein [Oscillospiraceae bacterium]